MPKLSPGNRPPAVDPTIGGSVTSSVRDTLGSKGVIDEMARSRKTASYGGNFVQAFPKFYDPTEFWDASGLPWNAQDPEHRKKLIKWLRMYYQTHHLIPILVDIFTRFPLVGIEVACKDQALKRFFEEEFLDKMDYEHFLVEVGRSYWTLGECFPLGNFNETTGTWNYEEIIPVENVEINNFPFLNSKQFSIIPPEYLSDMIKNRRPVEQFRMMQREFPDIVDVVLKGENIPVSDVLMKQVAFKVNESDTHGTPILLRALRTLIHEEKLLSSQDAIADRLYSPFILAKMGVQDVGDGTPWFPSYQQLEDLRDDIDMALSSEFRLLVHHSGLEMSSVFGRESMPRLDSDFDRVDATIMRTFGIHPQLLTGGVSNVPYASSALQAEFLNQILRTYQGYLKRHFRERAEVVAEAQGFYDYEKKGDKRIPILEEHLVTDDDGTQRIIKKNKLLIPDLVFHTFDLRDDATKRQFLGDLKSAGVPISDTTFMVGLKNVTFEDELERATEEQIQKTIAQQEGKLKLYKYLRFKGLPVPPELAAEITQMVDGEQPQQFPSPGPGLSGPPMGGGDSFAIPGEPGLGAPEGEGFPPPAQPFDGPAGGFPDTSTERTPLTPPVSSAMLKALDEKVAAIDLGENKRPSNMVLEGEGDEEQYVLKLHTAKNHLPHGSIVEERE